MDDTEQPSCTRQTSGSPIGYTWRSPQMSQKTMLYSYSFELQPNTTINHIDPNTYLYGCVKVGAVNVKIDPFLLPFSSPQQLKCHLTLHYQQPLHTPPILHQKIQSTLRHTHKTHYSCLIL